MSLDALVALSNAIGRFEEDQIILAEGNTSCRADDDTFFVKASGKSLAGCDSGAFVRVRYAPILASLRRDRLEDSEVRSLLEESLVEPGPLLPSVETFMHADLLTLPDVLFVGHSHATPLLSLLCLAEARELAKKRLFPDEIVLCGPEAVWVDYCDPGFQLAKAIRSAVLAFVDRRGERPKTIWMQNHGLIVLGSNATEVESGMRMQVKAARVLLGAISSGREVTFLTDEQIDRIHRRPDEHYRQRLLWAQNAKNG
ncbi:MAG: class II aldolase/adducin family protein [Fimbriimonadaceae bacterium]